MRARQFEILMATLGGWSSSDLDVRTRQLRGCELLPKGGRGPHAPEINAEHAATILLAMAVAPRAVDAGTRLPPYLSMVGPDPLDGQGSIGFREALAKVLADPAFTSGIEAVSVCRSAPQARISLEVKGAIQEFVYCNPANPAVIPGIREDLTFSGALLHQFSFNLKFGGATFSCSE